MESCQKCGRIRYAGDLFDGGCSDCCDWMVAKLAELTAERDALKAKVELATKCLEGLAFGLDSFGGRINRLKMMEAARQSLDAILNDAREGQ
jgi:hypothetical protein